MKYNPHREDQEAAFARLRESVAVAEPMALPDPMVRRELREAAKVSQYSAAAVCGVSPRCFVEWESGQTEPRPENRDAYERLLRVLAQFAAIEQAATAKLIEAVSVAA